MLYTLAYIPLRSKTTGVGALHWVIPPTRRFYVTYTNMLVYRNAKICVSPKANPKSCVTPNAKPQRKGTQNSNTPYIFFFLGSLILELQKFPNMLEYP